MKRLRDLLSRVRLRPFDTSTPEGRSQERYRRAALTAVASLTARGVRVVTQLVSVPLTLAYLGVERYGMWLTISSLSAVLVIANLGVGNGLTNLIADADARNDRERARRDLTTALVALLVGCGGAALIAALLAPFLPWADLYNVSGSDAVAEAGTASMVFIACWLGHLLFGIVTAVNRGHQDGFIDNVLETFASVVGLCALLLMMRAELGLPWLVLAFVGTNSAAHLLNWTALLIRRPYLRPSFASFDPTRLRVILGLGFAYLTVLVGFQIANGSRTFVVAHVLGAKFVPELEVPLRAFATLNMLFGVLINPLWPAFTESLARRDVAWLRSALNRAVWLSIVAGLALSVPLVLAGPWVIHLWVGDAVHPSFALLALIAAWFNLAGVSNALGVFLQAVHRVWYRAFADVGGALVGLGLQLLFVGDWGIDGVVLGMVVGEGVFRLLPLLWTTRLVLRQIESEPAPAAAAPAAPAAEISAQELR